MFVYHSIVLLIVVVIGTASGFLSLPQQHGLSTITGTRHTRHLHYPLRMAVPVDRDVYKPKKLVDEDGKDKYYDAIIIGSGIGGLTTGSLLAQQGQKVLVLEQHYIAGGCCHTFLSNNPGNVNRYEFSTGIHYVGDINHTSDKQRYWFDINFKNLLETLTLEHDPIIWDQMDNNYETAYIGGDSSTTSKTPTKYDIYTGEKEFQEELIRRFPDEKDAIEKYMKLVLKIRKVRTHFIILLFFETLLLLLFENVNLYSPSSSFFVSFLLLTTHHKLYIHNRKLQRHFC